MVCFKFYCLFAIIYQMDFLVVGWLIGLVFKLQDFAFAWPVSLPHHNLSTCHHIIHFIPPPPPSYRQPLISIFSTTFTDLPISNLLLVIIHFCCFFFKIRTSSREREKDCYPFVSSLMLLLYINMIIFDNLKETRRS